jgi:Leucine-rich repeat (LRR) protein
MKKLLLVLLALPFIGFGQQTYVPDNNFEAYLEANGMGDGISGNDYVNTANINTVTSLNVNGQNIADLTGIEAFTALTFLWCQNNQLTSLDVSQNTALTYLYCGGNLLDSLDVSQNTALTTLDCQVNQITSLDVSQNTALTYLDCQVNQITSLNVSGATALTYLDCYNNQLTSLNVSQNTVLTEFFCYNNQLTSLDVIQNTSLTALNCGENQLTSLDVSQNTALTSLGCVNNQLTSLDVSQNTALTELDCYNNQLTSLNVSQNTALTWLWCSGNQLSSLDVRNGNNTNFFVFEAQNNSNLYCIDVDNATWSTANWTGAGFVFDSWTSFDTNCATALGCTDSLACNYNSLATIDDGGCTYPPVTLNDNQVICSNFFNATLEVNYNTGSYTYLWSNGETTQSIDSLPMGSYSVIVTDTAGCSTTLNANVTLAPAPAMNMFPEICYVTVDSATGNNKVIVKPMANLLTSKFIIYKESSANIYSPIDTINSNILDYLDVSSNPMAQSYRYKISVLDTCSNESVKSDFHKTIHLTMSLGLNGEVNLLWNNYEGYQPSDYLIFRSVNNGSMNQVGILPGTNLAFTDLTPPSGILNYQVKAVVPTCNIIPFAKQLTNMLASNVINYSTTAVNELVNSKNVIKVTDLLGRETKATNQLLFYIYNDGTVEKKVVIE